MKYDVVYYRDFDGKAVIATSANTKKKALELAKAESLNQGPTKSVFVNLSGANYDSDVPWIYEIAQFTNGKKKFDNKVVDRDA